jgi:hypothetical protein
MAHNEDSGLLWVEPMMVVFEPSLPKESLRPPKQLTMNLRLPKRMVLLREKLSYDRRSPSERLEEKHAANPSSWRINCRCFLY